MGPAIVTRTGIRDEQQGTTNTIPLSEKVKQPSQVRVHRPPADRIEPILYYLTSVVIAGGHGSDTSFWRIEAGLSSRFTGTLSRVAAALPPAALPMTISPLLSP